MRKEKTRDSELALLCSIIFNPENIPELLITSDMFKDERNGLIFNAITKLYAKGVSPDYVSLSRYCPTVDPVYITEIGDVTATGVNFKHYEKQVILDWKTRELEKLSMEIREQSEKITNDEGIDSITDGIEKTLNRLVLAENKRQIVDIKDLIPEAVEKIEQKWKNKGKLSGIPTGIDAFDKVTNGLKEGRLYVFGGRPSSGKSLSALGIAQHIVYKEKLPIGFISLESSVDELILRSISSTGSVVADKLSSGILATSDFAKINNACEIMFQDGFYVYDEPNAKLSTVLSKAREMKRKHNIQALFLDYAQIVRVPSAKDRRESSEETSMAMKQLARDLNIPVVMLAQLKRDADEKRPTFGDFQWTSQFEQDADVACLIWHEYEKMSEDNPDPYKIARSSLLLDKVRDGKKTVIPVNFRGEYVRFEEIKNNCNIL